MNPDINTQQQITSLPKTGYRSGDYVKLNFRSFQSGNPQMSMWFMMARLDQELFPWWTFEPSMAEDVQGLGETWAISRPQSLFDCLFLHQLSRFAGTHLFAILPGSIKTQGWGQLKESDRQTYMQGQGCIYQLYGEFSSKLTINWVPFWQPQSLIRNPPFTNLWRLFSASQTAEDPTKNISFFSLSNPVLLPKVIRLLIEGDEHRSEHLADLVDWFGVYSSPSHGGHHPFAALYSKKSELIPHFENFQNKFLNVFEKAKEELYTHPKPSTIFRILSRQIAL